MAVSIIRPIKNIYVGAFVFILQRFFSEETLNTFEEYWKEAKVHGFFILK
jgi:hypothetical protein